MMRSYFSRRCRAVLQATLHGGSAGSWARSTRWRCGRRLHAEAHRLLGFVNSFSCVAHQDVALGFAPGRPELKSRGVVERRFKVALFSLATPHMQKPQVAEPLVLHCWAFTVTTGPNLHHPLMALVSLSRSPSCFLRRGRLGGPSIPAGCARYKTKIPPHGQAPPRPKHEQQVAVASTSLFSKRAARASGSSSSGFSARFRSGPAGRSRFFVTCCPSVSPAGFAGFASVRNHVVSPAISQLPALLKQATGDCATS
jgi:hypothetical protein